MQYFVLILLIGFCVPPASIAGALSSQQGCEVRQKYNDLQDDYADRLREALRTDKSPAARERVDEEVRRAEAKYKRFQNEIKRDYNGKLPACGDKPAVEIK